MKASKFNSFFKYDGTDVGYNSFTQEFIILDPLLFDLYLVGEKKGDFSELEAIHKDYYHFLVQQGFLVADELDEFEKTKELAYKIDNDDTLFHLIVNPTMNCNFKCWYCYETHIKDSKMDEKTISATISLIKNIATTQKNLKTFHLSFFGGEPLLYFEKVIKPILIKANSICREKNVVFHSSMTTNGLLINQPMLDFCKEYQLTSFQITLDGSREQHNKVRFISESKGSYDQIVNNILLCARNERYVSVRINCSVDTLNKLNDILDEFNVLSNDERKFINFQFHKVWQEVEEISDSLENSKRHFRANNFNVGNVLSTTLDSCYADKRYQATLNYNGEIFKCTARDFTNGTGEGVLNDDGTVLWNDKYEKRLNIKFKNKPCKECRILPICAGGCTQHALENEGVDYCVHDFNEDSKTRLIISRFEAILH